MDANGFFTVLIAVALVAVAATLALGIFSMFKGGAFNRKYGNVLMRWRVVLQAVALLLIFLLWAAS